MDTNTQKLGEAVLKMSLRYLEGEIQFDEFQQFVEKCLNTMEGLDREARQSLQELATDLERVRLLFPDNEQKTRG